MKLRPLANLRIRRKLFLLILGLVLVLFLIYTTLVVNQISGQMEAQGFRTAELVLGQTAKFVESRVDLVSRALDLITLNSVVRNLAIADPQPYSDDPGLWIRDTTGLRGIEDSVLQNNSDIRAFVLYMAAGLGSSISRSESQQYLALGDVLGKGWYQSLNPQENSTQWFAPAVPFEYSSPNDLHAVRRIPDDQNLEATVGYARADVRVGGIEEILDKAEFSGSTAVFLIDRRGHIVAKSQESKRLQTSDLNDLSVVKSGGWPLVSIRGTPYRTAYVEIGTTGWRLVLGIPNKDIGAFGEKSRNLLFLLLVIILPFVVPLSLWAASSSTRRLEILLSGVKRVGAGGFDVELPEDGGDEIGELTRNFNLMVDRIRDLVEERYQLGREVKNLELLALQAQINPHFLHNTLDLISGLAVMARQPRIVEAVGALSKFYRLSLSGGAEMIPLEKEIEHVSAYVRIQNIRFEGAVDLAVDLDPSLGQVPVLKMILQPLVENSILHGILEKPQERGRISIRAKEEEGRFLVLEVEDDGVGMDTATLEGLLARERLGPGKNGHGYGVFNIDRRLRLRYGEESGLRIESVDGQGTKVSIRVDLDKTGYTPGR